MKYQLFVAIILASFCSLNVIANNSVSIHISEDGIISTPQTPVKADNAKKIYINEDNLKTLDPKNQQDANKLANSIEFEVYRINEDSQTHTVFLAGEGVCDGYKNRGVEVTDSATYYIKDDSKDEYYANVSGGVLNDKGIARKVQYASVFNVNDEALSNRLKEQDKLKGRKIAEQNLKDRGNMLSNDVCHTN
ncbi:hypothetical protein ACT2CV_04840 [Pasteurellaceae bacterium 22721_9_1]